jgi:hypothetical protein
MVCGMLNCGFSAFVVFIFILCSVWLKKKTSKTCSSATFCHRSQIGDLPNYHFGGGRGSLKIILMFIVSNKYLYLNRNKMKEEGGGLEEASSSIIHPDAD